MNYVGGGIPVGRITEVCGPPGIGKTQLSIQVAVDVTIPELFGGLGKQAIYIGMSCDPLPVVIQNITIHMVSIKCLTFCG